jgi:hypothetical protein
MQSKDPTEFHEVSPFQIADWIVVLLCTALAIAVLGYNLNFTRLLSGLGL